MRQGRGRAARLVLPLALIAIGTVLWALSRAATASSQHAYSSGGTPPRSVQLVRGHTYWLAVLGGVRRLHLDVAGLRCTATTSGGTVAQLALQAEASDTKAVNEFASFVAADTGRASISCIGVNGVFVDNATAAPGDRAGNLLLLAVVSLAVSLPLLLSRLRAADGSPTPTGLG